MSYSSYKIITPPTTEPITLSDAKDYLRIIFTDEDALITSLITRARAEAERITHRAFATQQVQLVYTIERPEGGELSGPSDGRINWYHYDEQLGANPFGSAMYYFDLSLPPIQSSQPITVETKATVFDNWQTFTGVTYLDDNAEPARMYFQVPPTANVWRFTYTCGYDGVTYLLPPELQECLFELVSHFYENRDGTPIPQGIINKLLARRVDWI